MLLSGKICHFSNYFFHSIVWKILFVKFQGVESLNYQIFSVKFQELTPFFDLDSKVSFLAIFRETRTFSIFQYSKHSKTCNFKENKRKSR